MNHFKTIKIKKVRLSECHRLDGLVIVIDVIRAFTTAAFAFSKGAKDMILMGEVEDAFQLHKEMPSSLLIGEKDGMPIPGFHFDNSPVEIAKGEIDGKTLIFRTSSGTQGVVKSVNAEKILTASFVNAEATLCRIKTLMPKNLTFVMTGQKNGGFEDLALADYLESKLLGEDVDFIPYLQRVKESPLGKLFSSGIYSYRRQEDLDAVCMIDKFDFAQEVFKENGLHILRPVDSDGKLFK